MCIHLLNLNLQHVPCLHESPWFLINPKTKFVHILYLCVCAMLRCLTHPWQYVKQIKKTRCPTLLFPHLVSVTEQGCRERHHVALGVCQAGAGPPPFDPSAGGSGLKCHRRVIGLSVSQSPYTHTHTQPDTCGSSPHWVRGGGCLRV